MADGYVLEVKNLCKSYVRDVPVIDRLSMSLASGKIIGLLGPNGCGKSTFIKTVAGLLSADSGTISICGEPRSEQSNSLISYLPERPYFSSWMKVSELVNYFSDFYGDFDSENAYKMLSDLKINPSARMRTLSKGTKEKVQLILVMARKARLYLLDEPIAGVDPAARDYILSTIIGNYSKDATVIITTHLIYDIENVLDEFCFMGYGGRIILGGSVDEIKAERGKSLDEIFREEFRCSRNY